MKTGEIIRVIAIIVVGAILMFLIQPFIFRTGAIWSPSVQDPGAALARIWWRRGWFSDCRSLAQFSGA
jgi:hypothetical protein